MTNFGTKKVGLVRLDSGFFQKDILDYLEQKALNYIVAVRFTHPIQNLRFMILCINIIKKEAIYPLLRVRNLLERKGL